MNFKSTQLQLQGKKNGTKKYLEHFAGLLQILWALKKKYAKTFGALNNEHITQSCNVFDGNAQTVCMWNLKFTYSSLIVCL